MTATPTRSGSPTRPRPTARPLLALAALLLAACSDRSGDPRSPATPADGSAATAAFASQVAREDFIGSDACAGCHADQHNRWAESTHGRAGGEPDAGTVIAPFDGTLARFTNCESCHGPARRHVELMTDPAGAPSDIGLDSRVTDGVEESLNVCFQCHALKDVVQEGHLPGAPLAEYHALKLPVLGDDPYLADGRVRTFAYQGTHLSSSCYIDGSMTCTSCHEPHGLGYWDINRSPLADETDDRQCTSCHAAKATAPETHTFHPAGSTGARCVSCHMPYLQHPEVGAAVPFARSDHTIPVPRPRLDGRLGLVSACRGCHTDQSELRLQAQVDDWWGETKPHDPVTAGLLAVTDRMGVDQAGRMLLHPDAAGTLPQFQGLARFLTQWVRAGAGLGPDAADRVTRLAASTDPDLRALALATLHVAATTPGEEAADIATSSSAEPIAVRRRWVMILGFLSDEALARGDAPEAEALLQRALAVLPGDAGVLRSLGLLHNRTGDHAGAIAAFGESLAAGGTGQR